MTVQSFKPTAWNVKKSGKFGIYEMTLNKDEYTAIIIDVPPANLLPSKTMGINTYRANAVVSGDILVRPATIPEFTRSAGQDINENRISVVGSVTIHALTDDVRFFCIAADDFNDVMRLNSNHVLQPGETFIAYAREGRMRDVFVVDGEVMINGSGPIADFQHVKLGHVDNDYVITNESDAPAFVMYFYEATIQEVIDACQGVSSEALAQVPRLMVEETPIPEE